MPDTAILDFNTKTDKSHKEAIGTQLCLLEQFRLGTASEATHVLMKCWFSLSPSVHPASDERQRAQRE
jgi:hypothetical protein